MIHAAEEALAMILLQSIWYDKNKMVTRRPAMALAYFRRQNVLSNSNLLWLFL